MERPKLSVVIITYNQEKYLKTAIESVLKQKTDIEYELIISDDASNDSTADIIKMYAQKYSFIKPILNENNLGASKNYMEAIKNAIGEYIVVFEGDDYWIDENKIQKQYDFLKENKDYFAVSHVLSMRDDNNNFYGTAPSDDRIVGKDATMELFLKGITFSCMATMYRNVFLDKQTYEKYYSYVTAHRMVADFSLCMIFLTQGKLKVLEEALSVYRVSGETINTTSYNYQMNYNQKTLDHMFILRETEKFFENKYNLKSLKLDLTPRVFYLLTEKILKKDVKALLEILNKIPGEIKLHLIVYSPIQGVKELKVKLFKSLKL